ncbi:MULTISPECIES: AAA family ATPase [unclassified Pantoea]|uniref:AAA family ATPase n=1 Tax=unclassified Pantoea TaxID=2630326 RepID=UPI001CD5C636|nr:MULTISPECIES: AAA family ATPase [unclassified Pantoea]MCA1179740.1 AAA family ATPase [Pantoea sp. alder69]MCA1252335.1 AAA family ATPase [Pantoea sp. alder70]MCA1268083.1 AAA family ATPase [Pantoea sp. alder81]
MKIMAAEINHIGGIKRLGVNFTHGMNIICGPNGIGKSTILESISFLFTRNGSDIKKNIRSSADGIINLHVELPSGRHSFMGSASTFAPLEQTGNYQQDLNIRYLIRFGTERHLPYSRLEHIGTDPLRSEHDVSVQNNRGVLLHDLKGWLGKRYLLEDSTKNFFTENSKRNLELALSSINVLNADYSFSHIDGRNFDIFVNTPNGVIWYEYLSSGFKSCLAIIIGIIKEIELRFTDEDLYAEEFDGIVLIDEVEMHLHPEWQGKITEVLTTLFPQAQFIVTTHSPHVVQNGKPDQIIALEQAGDGETRVRSQLGGEYGYTGWTVDEVLRDVMGMESTLSRELEQKLAEFYGYIDAEDGENARSSYAYLDKILHPKNVLRKSLSMSLDMLLDSGEDA